MFSFQSPATDDWAAWIDPLLLERLIEGPLTAPAEQTVHAAVALLDLSGFTALANDLAQAGPRGAEQLKEILDDTFGRLTALTTHHGGRVLKFPGDAVLAIWPGQRADLTHHAQQAAAWGLRATADVAMTVLPHHARLEARASITVGEIRTRFVGGVDGRWECVVDGEPFYQLAASQRLARRGDTVVTAAAWRDLSQNPGTSDAPRFHATAIDGEHFRIVALSLPVRHEPGEDLPARPSWGLISPATLRQAMPAAVTAHLDAGASGWLAQLRTVSAVFVSLADQHRGRPLADLQGDMQAIQSAAARYGGVLNQVVVDDKGMVAVLGWGLSLSAHEDDAARALMASLAISAALTSHGTRGSIGIATGRVFTGARGGDIRREYAMIGAPINLAARLMQRADGHILCDDATRAAARQRVVVERVAASVDGGDDAPVFRVRKLRDASTPDKDDLIGRAAERETLLEALRTLEAGGPGSAFLIEGEPGIGKTRLISNLIRHTQSSHVRTILARGDAIERAAAYHPWRAPLEHLLGLSGLPTSVQVTLLTRLLDGETTLADRAPLLKAILPLMLDESAVTAQMTPQGRAAETRALLLHLLTAVIGNTPTLLVLEDAHWFDSASWALLEVLSSRLQHLMCVIAMRPMLRADLPAEAIRYLSQPAIVRIPLDTLGVDEAVGLASRCLDADILPPEFGALIWERTAGHPFYTEQFVLALRDARIITVDRGDCVLHGGATAVTSAAIPETVQGVITSRIDRLSAPQQVALKVASVIGLEFDARSVHRIAASSQSLDELTRDLDAMATLGLLGPGAGAAPFTYTFKHAITLQVTYDLLPFAQRLELHATVATHLESGGSGTHALLAYHWRQGGVAVKAFEHLVAAGEESARADSNREAADFFRQALSLDLPDADAPVTAVRRARCQRLLGEVLWVLGSFDDTRDAIAASFRSISGHDRWIRSRRRVLGVQALIQIWHLAAGSAVIARDERRRQALLELSRSARLLATLRAVPRDTTALLSASLLSLNLAERAGTTNVFALGMLGYAADAVGLRRLSSRYFERARSSAPEAADPTGYGLTLLFEAMVRFGAGEHARAVELLDEVTAIAARTGDRRTLIRATNLLAGVNGFTLTLPVSEMMPQVITAVNSIREQPVADRTYFLLTLCAIAAQLLRPSDAAAIFGPFESLVEPSLEECSDDAVAMMRGAEALFQARQGRLGEAIIAADRALAWGTRHLRELPPSGWILFEGPLETYLTACEQRCGSFATMRRAARKAIDLLSRYAALHPIYVSRAYYFRGRLARVDGRTQAARRMWEHALMVAERLGLTLDEGRARLSLAAIEATPAARRLQLEHVRRRLSQSGADFYVDILKEAEFRCDTTPARGE